VRRTEPVTPCVCAALGCLPSGYHAWVKRPTSERAATDRRVTEKIRAAHCLEGTYGVPRLQFERRGRHPRRRKRVARPDEGGSRPRRSRRRKFVTHAVRTVASAPDSSIGVRR